MAVSSLVRKPERRSEAQNAGNAIGYWDNITNFLRYFWRKRSFHLKMATILKILKYLR